MTALVVLRRIAVPAALMVATAAQAATEVAFVGTNDIQTSLIKQFPVGYFTAHNAWATKFYIPKAAPNATKPKFNFWDSGSILTIRTSVAHPTVVHTLMNAYSPVAGDQIGTIEFFGSAGARQTVKLIAGQNIRDFYHGAWANTINGTTARNAFTIMGVQGGAGTGNVQTGLVGTYLIDEQDFALVAAFRSQTLTRIVLTTSAAGGRPILLGVTVD